jgi:hypothetical protein
MEPAPLAQNGFDGGFGENKAPVELGDNARALEKVKEPTCLKSMSVPWKI